MAERDLYKLNRGKLRHPLFGNRQWWYDQQVKAGFWDDAMDEGADEVRLKMIEAIDAALEEIAKSA